MSLELSRPQLPPAMSLKAVPRPRGRKSVSTETNLIAGGGAGMMEALACHPLDTIKVRMQLSHQVAGLGSARMGYIRTGIEIVRQETALGLYRGLSAVLVGMVPKMAIRFTSFEWSKALLEDKQTGSTSGHGTFLAGLAAGVMEAVAVVTPMEVVKIRLQAQNHSKTGPGSSLGHAPPPKYRNAAHTLHTVLREEGVGALYRGVSLTALRQGSNQAVNFTVYTKAKEVLQTARGNQNELPGYETALIGLISGAMGPLSNAPIDTIKTRLQKTPSRPGETAASRMVGVARDLFRHEGIPAFYKGIVPRIMRVAPGQAVTFTVYELLREKLESSKILR